jgi:iron complex outermembrane receptor protein
VSTQFYKGDESNQNAPLPGYQVLNLHTAYQFWKQSELFLTVNNVFDRRYATYGIYSDPTGVGAPGIPPGANSNDPGVDNRSEAEGIPRSANGATWDNRFQNPAAPRSVFGGVRLRF